MTRVRIGIHVYQEPERLHSTLASIRANTRAPLDLLLLPDGPDRDTSAAISLIHLPKSATSEPHGAAASFNRLAAPADTEVVVFLESGCLVGPGWLDRLLLALDADPRNGLAGPTTNDCWNEQGVYRHSGDTADEASRAATDAAVRFGQEVRTLEPLHSLADFCYAVRREVIETIGEADEAYGLGPCWEMDYNIRAARAGFRGVWACAAYVHRAPFTQRRKLEEARRFEASKHRYQDKFCGARLQGHKPDYRLHCRGDACPNFAPPALIAIREPATASPLAAPLASPPLVCQSSRMVSTPPAQESPLTVVQREPLVSCIMPTSNRRGFLRQAIRCFLRQDYPHAELVVLDDGEDQVADCMPEDSRIRYIRVDQPLTIGARRDLACVHAHGDVIVHWDHNAWYPPWRVRAQVRALLDRAPEVCGSSRVFYYDAVADRTWEHRNAGGTASALASSTLAYYKNFWERHKFFDDLAGDGARSAWNGSGTVTTDLGDKQLCIEMLRPGNPDQNGAGAALGHPQPSGVIHALLGDDIHFYRTVGAPGESAGWPLVSCIMPTYNRRALLSLALRSFLAQDYPNRELIVVDDGEDAVVDVVSGVPGVRYFRLRTRKSIGAKRNVACQQAQGEIIAHWDDDDWYSPERLGYQVAPILTDQADLTGLDNAFVLEPAAGRFWTTRQDIHNQMFVGNVHGGTLVFRKRLFSEGLRYPELNLAEDASLLRRAMKRGKRLVRLSNPGVFVYMRHGRNAWKECVPGRFLDPAGWKRVGRPSSFSAAVLSSYQAATASM
jgi:O-antigen biosynthesis protein